VPGSGRRGQLGLCRTQPRPRRSVVGRARRPQLVEADAPEEEVYHHRHHRHVRTGRRRALERWNSAAGMQCHGQKPTRSAASAGPGACPPTTAGAYSASYLRHFLCSGTWTMRGLARQMSVLDPSSGVGRGKLRCSEKALQRKHETRAPTAEALCTQNSPLARRQKWPWSRESRREASYTEDITRRHHGGPCHTPTFEDDRSHASWRTLHNRTFAHA